MKETIRRKTENSSRPEKDCQISSLPRKRTSSGSPESPQIGMCSSTRDMARARSMSQSLCPATVWIQSVCMKRMRPSCMAGRTPSWGKTPIQIQPIQTALIWGPRDFSARYTNLG